MRIIAAALLCLGCDAADPVADPPLTLFDASVHDARAADTSLADMPVPDAQVAHCALEAPEAVTILEGSIATIAAQTEGTLHFEGEGLLEVRQDGEMLELKGSYGPPGEFAGTLIATCADGESRYPLTITRQALAFESMLEWRDDGPPAREYFSMWMDPLDPDALWIYGGFHYQPAQFTVAADMWRYDLVDGGWAPVESPDAPLRAGGGLAFVPGTPTAYYYGGLARDGDSFSVPFAVDRLTLDADAPAWNPVEVEGGRGTYQPAFFYHPTREVFITLGGQGPARTHMDVNIFDPAAGTWTPVEVARGLGGVVQPSGRTGFFWTWDPVNDRVVVFGGEQGGGQGSQCNCATDTWALDLTADPPRWQRLASDGPEGRRNGLYAYDPYGERLFVWGGTPDGMSNAQGLWAFDLRTDTWHELTVEDSAPLRSSGVAVIDAARGRMLLGFGNNTEAIYQDLWAVPLTIEPLD